MVKVAVTAFLVSAVCPLYWLLVTAVQSLYSRHKWTLSSTGTKENQAKFKGAIFFNPLAITQHSYHVNWFAFPCLL